MLNEDFWSVYARVYDIAVTTLHPYRMLQRTVLGRLRLHGTGHMVDAGCGTLSYGDRIARRYPGVFVTGLENNRGMIEEAHGKTASRANIAVRRHDFNTDEWPVDCTGIDAILSINMLYTLKDAGKFLREAHQALMPGGQLLLVNLSNPDLRRVLGDHYMWRMMQATAEEAERDDALLWARRVVTVLNEDIARASRGQRLNVYNPLELGALVRTHGFEFNQETDLIPDVYAGTAVLIDAVRK